MHGASPPMQLIKGHSTLKLCEIDLFSYVCKLPIVDHVMLSREFFLYVSENYSFIFTRICLNLKRTNSQGHHHVVYIGTTNKRS